MGEISSYICVFTGVDYLFFDLAMLVHFFLALFVPALAIDLACDDCITLIDSFVNLSVADEAIVEQQALITMEICPEADLGPPDAHPNCEKFTEHHWPDLARYVFPIFLNSTFICTDVVGSCFSSGKVSGVFSAEIGCADCTQALGYMAGFLALPQTGVPEGDTIFCIDYSRVVIPQALPLLAPTASAQQEDICRNIAQVC